MNAPSVLVLILVLSFAADRLAKALVFGARMIPEIRQRLPEPEGIDLPLVRAAARRREALVYAVLVGVLAGLALLLYPEVRLVRMLAGPQAHPAVDIVVSLAVVMGGSDLVGRVVSVSGLGEGLAPPPSPGRDGPVEIVGRVELIPPQDGPTPQPAPEDDATRSA